MNNEEKILSLLETMNQRMDQLGSDVGELKQDVAGLKQDVAGLKQDVAGLKQDVAVLKDDVAGLKQNVSRLQEDMSTLKEDVSRLQDDMVRVEVTLENTVANKLDLLFEGHATIMEKVAFLERQDRRVTRLETDMAAVKAAVRTHSEEIRRLKGA